ncbi:hypothetical protein LINPERHAP1_LOCUS7262, partial [Linum perenne]
APLNLSFSLIFFLSHPTNPKCKERKTPISLPTKVTAAVPERRCRTNAVPSSSPYFDPRRRLVDLMIPPPPRRRQPFVRSPPEVFLMTPPPPLSRNHRRCRRRSATVADLYPPLNCRRSVSSPGRHLPPELLPFTPEKTERWGELRGEEEEKGRKEASWPKPEEEGEVEEVCVNFFSSSFFLFFPSFIVLRFGISP